jgi:hypothetical protein
VGVLVSQCLLTGHYAPCQNPFRLMSSHNSYLVHNVCMYNAASGLTSKRAPLPWHKVREAEEGELKVIDEFEGVKTDGRGMFINEMDQQRYLNEEVAEWKAEALEDYYDLYEPQYPDIPKLTAEQVLFMCVYVFIFM